MSNYIVNNQLVTLDYTPGSILFNGTDDSISFGAQSEHNIAANDATITVWIKNKSIASLVVPLFRGLYAGTGFYWQTYNSNFEVVQGATQMTRTDGGLAGTQDVWTHWTFKKIGGGKWYIYKNTTELTYLIQSAIDPASSTTGLYIGSYNGASSFYSGYMTDVRWFNRALTTSEIETVYNLGTINYGLVGHWLFNDGSGAVAADSSSYSFDGVISGSSGEAIHTSDHPAIAYVSLPTMSEYVKRSNLQPNMTAEFQLNLGTTLTTAQDITKYIINASDVTEKLTRSATSTGGVILPNMKIKLKNDRSLWDKLGSFFKEGFINNSVIKITIKYTTSDGEDVTPSYIYQGIIKYSTSAWNRNKFIFETTLTPSSSLIATNKIAAGVLANDTFKEICYKILNRTPFTRYLTIDKANFTMGWDVSVTDSIADMTNKKVKSVLDKIMLLTGSVYYVNYAQEFIIAPITPTAPTAVCTFRANDIFKIMSEEYYWKGHYTAITWDDSTNTVQRVEMSYPDRDLYQYDFTELTVKEKYVTDTTNRATILTNLLTMYKFLKRKVKLTCKWNPEVLVNTYISIDIAEEAIAGDEYLVFNKDGDQWNDSKFWGLAQPGITFDSTGLWRVLDVKRDSEGEKMKLTIVQYQSDDEV